METNRNFLFFFGVWTTFTEPTEDMAKIKITQKCKILPYSLMLKGTFKH